MKALELNICQVHALVAWNFALSRVAHTFGIRRSTQLFTRTNCGIRCPTLGLSGVSHVTKIDGLFFIGDCKSGSIVMRVLHDLVVDIGRRDVDRDV